MRPAGLEPTIPASERPQTHALDRAVTGTGQKLCTGIFKINLKSWIYVADELSLYLLNLYLFCGAAAPLGTD
jgi:hypothetical protein